MAAPTFQVIHQDHAGTAISTISPVAGSLRWSYRMANQGGPGDIQCEFALSDDNVGTDDFAPYRTDWRLIMDGAYVMCGGITTSVNLNSDNGIFGTVAFAGLDWLHYLEQPYPFNYSTIVTDVATNQLAAADQLFKSWAAQTQETVIQDLFDSISAYDGTVTFVPAFNGTGWSTTINYEFGFGDDTTILDLILDVAQLGSGLGFDMWCDQDGSVTMTCPRVTDPTAVTPIYTLDDSSIVAPPLDWTNNGPRATDTVTFGAGDNNTNRIGFSKYQASRDTYRRWVRFAQTTLTDTTTIAAAADSIGTQDRFPHKDLKVTVRPDLIDSGDSTAGFFNLLGEVITVNYNVAPYHHINADFWIVEQQFYTPDGCNWLCDLALEQIYQPTGSPLP